MTPFFTEEDVFYTLQDGITMKVVRLEEAESKVAPLLEEVVRLQKLCSEQERDGLEIARKALEENETLKAQQCAPFDAYYKTCEVTIGELEKENEQLRSSQAQNDTLRLRSLKKDVAFYRDRIAELEYAMEQETRRIQRLEKALEFYANERNWETQFKTVGSHGVGQILTQELEPGPASRDFGEIARAALELVSGGKS